ncbi:MAG: glycosyltransferase [Patescibacteria group bacterium]
MDKKISVTAIVPAYNEAPRISQVLSFLTNCTEIDEVIVVDDGSTDDTSKIIESSFPNVKLIRLGSNKGKGYAVASGVESSRGDIVVLIDADLSGLQSTHISKLLHPLLKSNYDAVISVRDYWSESLLFRALSGERAYYKKDLLPLLSEMKSLGFRLELFLNYAFHNKKVKVVLLEGVTNPLKFEKTHGSEGITQYIDITKELISHIFEQDSPLEYFYKTYIKNFYLPLDTKTFSKKLTVPEDMKKGKNRLIRNPNEIKVSVVIPAYNEESYIGKTLESLQKQTVKPDEIIVVDNASTDKTSDIAKSYGARVICEPRSGTSFARKTGFDAASFEVIARTDADTIPDKKWIENIKKYFARGIDALTGPVFLDTPVLKKNYVAYESFMILLKLILGTEVWLGANTVLTKSLWTKAKKHLLEDDRMTHEDTELALAVAHYSRIKYKRDVVVFTSDRRLIHNPKSLFGEYQLRLFKMAARKNKTKINTSYSKMKKFFDQEIFGEDW